MGWRKDRLCKDLEQFKGWRSGSMELGRLTLVGWLVLLLSTAAALLTMVGVADYWHAHFSNPQGKNPAPVVAAFVGIGVFFGIRTLLHQIGVKTHRSKRKRRVRRLAAPDPTAPFPEDHVG
jgi:hypothetical protein